MHAVTDNFKRLKSNPDAQFLQCMVVDRDLKLGRNKSVPSSLPSTFASGELYPNNHLLTNYLPSLLPPPQLHPHPLRRALPRQDRFGRPKAVPSDQGRDPDEQGHRPAERHQEAGKRYATHSTAWPAKRGISDDGWQQCSYRPMFSSSSSICSGDEWRRRRTLLFIFHASMLFLVPCHIRQAVFDRDVEVKS